MGKGNVASFGLESPLPKSFLLACAACVGWIALLFFLKNKILKEHHACSRYSKMGRKRKASPPRKDVDLKSPLAVLLLKRWSVGDIPAVLIQEIADAAVKSGCKEPDVLVLQSLGSNGQQPGNIHRDLKIKFFKNMVAPEPHFVQTTIKQKTSHGADKELPGQVPVLLPHQWVPALLENNFEDVLGMEGVPKFWKEQLNFNNPRIHQSKAYFKALSLSKHKAIPFAVSLGLKHIEFSTESIFD